MKVVAKKNKNQRIIIYDKENKFSQKKCQIFSIKKIYKLMRKNKSPKIQI